MRAALARRLAELPWRPGADLRRQLAHVELRVHGVERIAATGDRYPCRVELVNRSRWSLAGKGPARVELGWRWSDAAGALTGEGTAPLPKRVAPGARAEILAGVRTPDAPGPHRLAFSLLVGGERRLAAPPSHWPEPRTIELRPDPWWREGDAALPVFAGTPELNHADFRRHLEHAGRPRPLALAVETVNVCNNDCVICAYGIQSRPKRKMPLATFEKVLRDYSELGGGVLCLTPIVGDVMMDPLLVERLRLCERYPRIRRKIVTTNGEMARRYDDATLDFVLNHFDKITVSVYGLDAEEYRAMTKRDRYESFRASLDRILRLYRGELRLNFRLLKDRTREDARRWLEGFAGRRAAPGRVSVGRVLQSYANWGVLDMTRELPFQARWRNPPEEEIRQCGIPLGAAQVLSNGNVSFCPCDDYDNAPSLHLGNVNEQSLAEMYASEKVRALWSWRTCGVPEFCRRCTFKLPIGQLGREHLEDPTLLIS